MTEIKKERKREKEREREILVFPVVVLLQHPRPLPGLMRSFKDTRDKEENRKYT